MTTASPDQTILSASTFISSIGVNTHVGYSWGGYNNLALVEDDLKYLGVTKLRDGLASNPSAQPILDGLAKDGYTFDLVVPSSVPAGGASALQAYLASVKAFATSHPGSVIALEGLNEANIMGFTYNGSSSVSAAAQFQAVYYSAIKADATLKDIAVYNLSLGYNDTADYAKLGDLSSSTDYANSHAYVSTSLTPAAALQALLGNATSVTGSDPVVITETGYTTKTDTPYIGANENVQAKSILNTLVDAYKDGVSTTYLYQLLDASETNDPSNPESHYGLFNSDGTPKLAATAIHNLTTILADDGKGGHQPTASLNYTLDGLPASGNSMVLGKSNGAYELVVWAEPKIWNDATDTEIANPTTSVTVNLGSVHHLISVYDPLKGTSPIATYTDVSQIVIPISDHPLIIEIDAPAGGSTAQPAVTDVSGTAADIVSQMSALNAAGVQTITLTDSHVLPVASEATMAYMISHYATALAAIKGGYQFSVTNSTASWSVTKVYDSAAKLLSTSTSNFTNGIITSKVTVNSDGSSDNQAYSGGKLVRDVSISADGNKDTKTYDTSGNLVADMIQNKDGSSSNTLYTAGVKTKAYVTNADGSHDNYYYNITGQSYTSEHDHLDANNKLLSISRTHADGTMAYSQVFNADGSKITTQYDATGHKTSVITVTSTSTTTELYTASGVLKQQIVQTTAGGVTTTNYNGTMLASVYIVNADGSKESKLYDSSGRIASDLIQNKDGSSSNTLYTAGVKTKAYVTNADGSHDNYYYNITGQSYTSEHDHLDAGNKLVSVTRTHADGTMAYSQVFNGDGSKVTTQYDSAGHKTSVITVTSSATTTNIYTTAGALKQTIVQTTTGNVTTTNYNGALLVSSYVVNADGSKQTKLYDSKGVIASDLVQNKDGSSSNTIYAAGVKSKVYVTNADGSHDNYYYNITGQSYTTEHDFIDASGRLLLVSRTHADGTMAYSQVLNSDGSKVTTQYDATGHKTSMVTATSSATVTDTYDPATGALKQEVTKTSSGNTTTTNYNGSLLASVYIVNADGSKETKLYDSSGKLASDLIQNKDGSSSNTIYSAGVKMKLYVTNADGSQDNTYYNIAGQNYTTEIQHTTAAGALTSLIRLHADGTLAYKQLINGDGSKVTDLYDSTGHKTSEILNGTDGSTTTDTYNSAGSVTQHVVKTAGGDVTTTNYVNGLNASIYVVNADGTKETKLFDSTGSLTSDYVLNKDGSNSTTVYSAGVKTKAYVNNADGSHDNYAYNITGKSYVTEHQHLDATNKVTLVERSHADGTLDYTQVLKPDGSKITDVYDSSGVKTQETVNNADGSSDVFKFKVSGLPGAIEHDSYNASGSLLAIDVLNSDGTHAVTAVSAGLTLNGGSGNDVFSAAPGTTTVMFGGGNDQIKSFHAGTASNHDTIEILKSLVADYSHLQISQSGSDTLIQLTSADSILLKNVNSATLDQGNFLFV